MKPGSAAYIEAAQSGELSPRLVAAISLSDAAPAPIANFHVSPLEFNGWSLTRGQIATVTTNVAEGLDGTTTADQVEDDAAGARESIGQGVSDIPHLNRYRWSIYIQKDATGRATRFPEFMLIFTDGPATYEEVSSVFFDTETGETGASFFAAAANGSVRVENAGAEWWRLVVELEPVDSSVLHFEAYIFPASGASAVWSRSAPVTGSIIVWGAQFHDADASEIFTSVASSFANSLRIDTNLLTYSEQFDHADWTVLGGGGLTVTADDDDAPDGSATADLLANSGSVGVGVGRTLTISGNNRYFLSMFIKKDAVGHVTRFARIFFGFGPTTFERYWLDIDTATGELNFTIGTGGSDGDTDPNVIYAATPIGDDYWRIWIGAQPIGVRTAMYFNFYPSAGQGASWTITGTAGSCHAWGAQISKTPGLINYYTAGADPVQHFAGSELDRFYVSSHEDCLVPDGVWPWDHVAGGLKDISGHSMRIRPDRATHTIGNIQLQLADVDGEISARFYQRDLAGESLRRKQVQIFKGDQVLTSFDDYSRRVTMLIDKVSFLNKVFLLNCSDINRTAKVDIFERHQGVLTTTVNASASAIPITIAEAATKFPLLVHDAAYRTDPSTTVGYIQIDDEIIRHTGWNGAFTELNVDTGGRGALGTAAATHTVTGSEDDQKKKVTEYIYIEMAAPRLVYAILSGVIIGEATGFPEHWSLGITESYIRRSDFERIGADLWDRSDNGGRMVKFQGLEKTEAKRFIERELLLWLGCFMPIYSDGAYGLRRLQNVLPNSSYDALLDDSQISRIRSLEYDQDAVINILVLKWNYLKRLDSFMKSTTLVDVGSISKNEAAPVRVHEFKGVFAGRHSDSDMQAYFNQLRDRYGHAPMLVTLDALPQCDRLDVGDVCRVQSSSAGDYLVNGTLDRSLEVQGIRTNWRTGAVTLDLFGGIKAAEQSAIASSSVINDSFYTTEPTELSTVLTISAGVVTANGTLDGHASNHNKAIYYFDGDLEIQAGVTVTINRNVQLRIKGFFEINGDIDGAGQGNPGAASTAAKLGKLGIPGICGSGYTYEGVKLSYVGSSGKLPRFNIEPPLGEWDQKFNSFSGLNISNPDGDEIRGIPKNLQGTSGAAGHGAQESGTYEAAGGAGGASGAGLVVICRGCAFGDDAALDLSGADGGAPGSFSSTYHSMTVYAGAGQGGFPGACLFLLDGNVASPIKSHVICNAGDTPIPDVKYNIGWDRFATGGGVAYGKPFNEAGVWNFAEGNVGIYFLPAVSTGYSWSAADEIQEAPDLAFVLS